MGSPKSRLFAIGEVCARRPSSSVIVLLGLLVGCAYGNVIFAGKSLVYSDNYNPLDYRPLPDNYGPGFVPPERWQTRSLVSLPNIRDPGATFWQWEPAAEFLRQALADGEPPFWDPYVGGGAPLMANLTQAPFFPPSLAVVVAGNGSPARNALHLALILAAGLFTWSFLRHHGLSTLAAATGATGFMLGGAVVQTAGSFIGQAVACIPFVMWITARFVVSPTVTRGVVMAAGYATAALASFPPALLQAFGFAAAYALVMILSRHVAPGSTRWQRAMPLARYAAFALLGAALVAFYYLPAIELAGVTPHVASFYAGEGLRTLALRNFAQLWWPVIAGGAAVYDMRTLQMSAGYLSYAGAGLLCLAMFSDRRGEGDRGPLWLFSLVLAALIALKLLGVPPVQWIAYLPVFNSIHYTIYFGFGVGFLAAVVGAIGCENIRQRRVSTVRVGMAIALVALLFAWLLREGSAQSFVRWVPPGRWLFECLLSMATAGAIMVVAAVSCRRRARVSSSALAAAVLSVVAAEGVRNAAFPRQVRNDVFKRPPPYVRALQEHGPLVRVFTLGNAPNANTNSPFAISQWDSLSTFNSTRMFELYRRYAAPQAYLFLREAPELPPEPVLDAAGIGLISVRVVVTDFMEKVRPRGYRQLFEDGYVAIFARTSPPRCFFTSDFEVLPPSDVLEAVAAPRAAGRILLDTQPPNLSPSANRPDDPPPTRIVLRRNSLDLSLRAPRDGLVYCSEALMPGWTATVNGEERPLLFANHAFRAVEVSAGDAEIRMTYRPPGFLTGSAVSLAALVIAGVLVGRAARRPTAGHLASVEERSV